MCVVTEQNRNLAIYFLEAPIVTKNTKKNVTRKRVKLVANCTLMLKPPRAKTCLLYIECAALAKVNTNTNTVGV